MGKFFKFLENHLIVIIIYHTSSYYVQRSSKTIAMKTYKNKNIILFFTYKIISIYVYYNQYESHIVI